ncbi:squalene cyclase [Cumulibacter manganitolerans]|uniref:squalene cyclase n=1 Tax=Cumulibacter manganitolerans TaxID=1884992 RepID=UPI00129725E2|nr:squalene cyclase [Cumulibacter manganitolerans]
MRASTAVEQLLPWLLDTDVALRWRVERDLAGAPPSVWQATRARVGTEGMAARLIAAQDPDGQWAGGAYFPSDATPDEPGQPWTATTWTLTTLREWGADPADLRYRDTAGLLERNARWEYDDLPYWDGEVDCCINAMTVANGLWLGRDMRALAHWFPEHRLADGGWNCEWVEGSRRSSVHSTLNSLKGLLEYERTVGAADPRIDAIREARRGGEEYLLERRLLHRLRDGRPFGDWVTNSIYPMRWKYSALHALNYFRDAAAFDGTEPDARCVEAIELLRAQQQPDGTFLQGELLPGRTWVDIDVPAGRPSPWVTYHALRVLTWWDDRPA